MDQDTNTINQDNNENLLTEVDQQPNENQTLKNARKSMAAVMIDEGKEEVQEYALNKTFFTMIMLSFGAMQIGSLFANTVGQNFMPTFYALMGIADAQAIDDAQRADFTKQQEAFSTMNVNVGLAGTCFGTFIAGFVMKLHRVKVLLVLNALNILIAYPSIYVQNLTVYYVASFIGGGIGGTVLSLLPIILLETLPSAVFAQSQQVMMTTCTIITLGMSYCTMMMPDPDDIDGLMSSKFYIYLNLTPCFFYVVPQIYFQFIFKGDTIANNLQKNTPESRAEALKSIKTVYKEGEDYQEIFESLEPKGDDEKIEQVNYLECFKSKQYQKGSFVAIYVALLFQVCGQNIIGQQITVVLKSIGVQNSQLNAMLNIYHTFSTAGMFLGIYLIKKMGRKQMLIQGQLYSAILLFCIAGFCFVGSTYATLCAFLLYKLVGAGFLNTVCFVYLSECLIDTQIQMSVMVMTVAVGIFNNMLTWIMDTFGTYALFLLFGCLNLVLVFFSLFLLKETKGLTFIEKKQVFFPKEFQTGSEENMADLQKKE